MLATRANPVIPTTAVKRRPVPSTPCYPSKTTLLIDLDGVLVHPSFLQSVPHRIARYAVTRLGYDVEKAEARCRAEYRMHGTNLEGFFARGYGKVIDTDEYHQYIHGHLPYHELIRVPKPFSRALSKYRCILFTNADLRHAIRCLEALGLEHQFADVVCFESMQSFLHDAMPGHFVIKPKDTAMRAALHMANVNRDEVVYFDDSVQNIHMGLRNSVRSVLVSPRFDPATVTTAGGYVSSIQHFEHVI